MAGKPDTDLHSRGDAARYEVLGYHCSRHEPRSPLDSLVDCCTAFYLVRGKLGLFFTLAGKPYSESHGIRVGTATARAERLLHRKVYLGAHCGPGVELQSKRARLAIFFDGETRTPFSTPAACSSAGTWSPSICTARIAIRA